MSIIIKESEENTQSAELLYTNSLINPYRNFYNEIYLLKSIPLIQEVVEDLGFSTSVYKEGNVLTLEKYNRLPYTLNWVSSPKDITNTISFRIEVETDTTFFISSKNNAQPRIRGFLGDTLTISGSSFYFTKKFSVDVVPEEEFILRLENSLITAQRYIKELNVNWAQEGSSVIDLSLYGIIPNKNIDFLSQMVKVYTENDLARKVETSERTIEFIELQMKEISDSLKFVELQLEAFKDKNVITDLGAEAQRLFLKVENLEEKKGQLKVEESYLQYLNDYIENDKNFDKVILPSTLGISDPILSALITRMVDAQLSLNASIPQNENPVFLRGQNAILEIRSSIKESVKSKKATIKISNNQIDEDIKNIELQLRKLPKAERQLVSIERQYKFSENLYNFLSQKRTEASISKASAVSDIQVINPALKTSSFIYPNKQFNYILAIVFGIIIPFVLYVSLEYFNNKIQSKEDIEHLTNIPFSGSIGHSNHSSNFVVNENPKSAMAESFRALRANLNFFNKETKHGIGNTFLITSSVSGEGKTFTTINLGAIFALSGKKTLLIGADLRKPRLHKEFNIENNTGLSNYLIGNMQVSDIIKETQFDQLFVMCSGPIPPNPAELLLKKNMAELLEKVKKIFDVVIIDTSPLGLVTDALTLSGLVDHSIYIIRQGHTPARTIGVLDELLEQQKIEELSIVLNDVVTTASGYGYSYGYGYGNGKKSGNGYYE
ncbi:MAG: polysaccharide biosynthesis tyrosine autokinase [Flavobacteriaceae bacterium]|nr:polysaccharide biosynthesis tyrosine autokinase [Flavobacteriaceae bacterium]